MKKVLKNKVFWCMVVLLSIVGIVAVYGYSIYVDIKGEEVEEEVVVTDVIEKELGSFVLYNDSTDYQRGLFDSLIENDLTEESTAEDIGLYVDIYAQNFIADYLTLNVKDPLLDRVGGKQFLIEVLQDGYEELDGVSDYYISKNYYIKENEDTYETTLPEVSNLEVASTEKTTFDYYDATSQNDDKEKMEAYVLTYNVAYVNEPVSGGMTQFNEIRVIVANWDGVWTVVEIQTDLYKSNPTVISMY